MVSIALILMNAPLTFTLAATIEHVSTHLGRANVFAMKILTAVFQSMAAFRGVIQARNQDFMWGVLTRLKWTRLPKCIFYCLIRYLGK